MGEVLVLGAEGALGRALIARLDGLDVRAVGRDPDQGSSADHLAGVLSDGRPGRVVVDATGAIGDERQATAARVLQARAHLVDPLPVQAHALWLRNELDAPARSAGTTVVTSCGLAGGLGTLLAVRAAQATAVPTEAHVAYLLLDRRGHATEGLRAAATTLLDGDGVALVDGQLEQEQLAEARRLAWFARPVGPHHAAGVPGIEAVLLPGLVPTLRTVRSYIALRTAFAEILQLIGNAARWEPARRLLEQALLAGDDDDEIDPGATRWAIVAEVAGNDGVARAWANGRGIHNTTATAAALAVRRLLDGGTPPGVVGEASLGPAVDLLDDLAREADLRWSVIRPDDEVSAASRR